MKNLSLEDFHIQNEHLVNIEHIIKLPTYISALVFCAFGEAVTYWYQSCIQTGEDFSWPSETIAWSQVSWQKCRHHTCSHFVMHSGLKGNR